VVWWAGVLQAYEVGQATTDKLVSCLGVQISRQVDIGGISCEKSYELILRTAPSNAVIVGQVTQEGYSGERPQAYRGLVLQV
jgi:hypothetical protein